MRTPEQQAKDFIEANDKSPVVSGYAIEPRPEGSKGVVYTLKDQTKHRLGSRACKLVTEPYPIWDI